TAAARSALRDPMMTGLPASANLRASPRPWSPVPPRIPIDMDATSRPVPGTTCWSDMAPILPEQGRAMAPWGRERRAGRRAPGAARPDRVAGPGGGVRPDAARVGARARRAAAGRHPRARALAFRGAPGRREPPGRPARARAHAGPVEPAAG